LFLLAGYFLLPRLAPLPVHLAFFDVSAYFEDCDFPATTLTGGRPGRLITPIKEPTRPRRYWLFYFLESDLPIAWTQDDLDKIKCAILKKATGQRLTSIDLGGRLEAFADVSLEGLRALADEIAGAISSSTRPRVYRARYDKGL